MLIVSSLSTNARQLDPTLPFAKSVLDREAGAQKLKLYSVIVVGETRKVIINKKTMTVGDSLGEFKLIKIEKQKVVLQSSSDTIELFLFTTL